METQIEKPTLESLGLKCTIVARGIGRMNEDDKEDGQPMLKWNALFTNMRGQQDTFDYFTGIGCGPQMSEAELRLNFPLVANVPKHNRHNIKDKSLLAQIASRAAFKANWTPDPIEILWAIARDGDALESTFEDWASDLGYDADSRKAEKVYRACQDNALRLKKILSADKIELLKGLEI